MLMEKVTFEVKEAAYIGCSYWAIPDIA